MKEIMQEKVFSVIYRRNVLSAQRLEVFLLRVGPVLRVKRSAWSMAKRRSSKKRVCPSFPLPSPRPLFLPLSICPSPTPPTLPHGLYITCMPAHISSSVFLACRISTSHLAPVTSICLLPPRTRTRRRWIRATSLLVTPLPCRHEPVTSCCCAPPPRPSTIAPATAATAATANPAAATTTTTTTTALDATASLAQFVVVVLAMVSVSVMSRCCCISPSCFPPGWRSSSGGRGFYRWEFQ